MKIIEKIHLKNQEINQKGLLKMKNMIKIIIKLIKLIKQILKKRIKEKQIIIQFQHQELLKIQNIHQFQLIFIFHLFKEKL